MRPRRHLGVLAALLAAALVLVACGGDDQPSSVTWRNVTLPVPEGWYVVEQEATRLTIASHDLRDPEGPFEGDVLAIALTYRPRTLPADWRRWAEEQDATIETDDRLVLPGEVPATRLVYRYVTDDVATREMVVLIPSRAIEALAQPIPGPGDTDAPEVFLRNIETFLGVFENAEFGPPLLD